MKDLDDEWNRVSKSYVNNFVGVYKRNLTRRWNDLVRAPKFKEMERSVGVFEKSPAGKELTKELSDIQKSVDKYVKYTESKPAPKNMTAINDKHLLNATKIIEKNVG